MLRTPARLTSGVRPQDHHQGSATLGKLISWLAVLALLYFAYFILSRIWRLLRWRKSESLALHDHLADVAEDIAGASRIAAALSSAVAFFVAPAGLLAIGAALGFVPVPLIVRLVPFLLIFAAAAAALSALAKLYAKSRRKREKGSL